MIPFASLRAGCRRGALPFASVVLVLLPPVSAAQAQRLLTLVSGVAEAASVGESGPSIGPAPTAVQVDLELLRGAPARLEVPTPDGSVLSAERSVFEDRGGGDLMWSGGQPGAGYDTVVLTVEGGRLVGRFGAAGGGVYQIHAERDGRGGMAPVVGPGLDGPEPWCAVEAGAEDGQDIHAHGLAGAHAADPPERVSNPQSHDRLDILVAYTATAAENWADRGGALAAIRHAGDYLKMVFRNNDLPVEPHIVHIAQASAGLDRAGRDRGWHEFHRDSSPLRSSELRRDGELLRLRHEHRADLVHLFTGEHPYVLRACGLHPTLQTGGTAESFSRRPFGWTSNQSPCLDYAAIFVHEIGHGLGANHEPASANISPEARFRPYAVGHVNLDVMPSIGTAMSYRGQIEPFFSTPRFRLYGAVIGVRDEQDNERTLRETVHIGVRYSDYLESLEGLPAPPSGLRVWFDGGSAHLAWQDNAPAADGYELECCGGRILTLEGRTEATIPLENTEPGTRYEFWLRARKGEARSLRSSIVALIVPGESIEAPSDISVTVSPSLDIVDVRWTDNSDNESGFDLQLLLDGEPFDRRSVMPDREHAIFARYEVGFSPSRQGPEGGAEYGVRVFAYNPSGYSKSSEVATFRWEHPLAPGPVADVAASAIGPMAARVTWTTDPENAAWYVVRATLPGWDHDGLRVSDGVGWVDFEALSRGGRYTFEVQARTKAGFGLPSRAYLTLGERGPGPEAPSDLSWQATEDGEDLGLKWKDNSSDELGFEVQRGGGGSWRRMLTVPPDTESVSLAAFKLGNDDYRVFAYNERGFSASSPHVRGRSYLENFTATVADAEVRLGWRLFGRAWVWVTGMQVRWKATSALPFDDAVDAWTDLPASARAYTVTGLKNGTEYTFAARDVTASGAGPRRPRRRRRAPRRGCPPRRPSPLARTAPKIPARCEPERRSGSRTRAPAT